MNTLIEVRSPHPDDLNAIVAINRKSLPENYPVAYFIDLIRTWKTTSCVAELNGRVVGYVILRLESQRSFFTKTTNFSKGHIISVAVLEEARRMGIASKMMDDVIEKTQNVGGIESIVLEVRESNIGAIQLYLNYGFIKSKILQRYYADGESAVLMTLYLECVLASSE